MSFLSRLVTFFGMVLLIHAGYSAHEHTVLFSNTRLTSSTALPRDIVAEVFVAVVIVSIGLVLGLEQRHGFWDIRAKRREFAEWVRGDDMVSKK